MLWTVTMVSVSPIYGPRSRAATISARRQRTDGQTSFIVLPGLRSFAAHVSLSLDPGPRACARANDDSGSRVCSGNAIWAQFGHNSSRSLVILPNRLWGGSEKGNARQEMGSTGELQCPLVGPRLTAQQTRLLNLGLSLLFLCSHRKGQQDRASVPQCERAEREQRKVGRLVRGRNAAPGKRLLSSKQWAPSLTTVPSRPTPSKLKVFSDYSRVFFNPWSHHESCFVMVPVGFFCPLFKRKLKKLDHQSQHCITLSSFASFHCQCWDYCNRVFWGVIAQWYFNFLTTISLPHQTCFLPRLCI